MTSSTTNDACPLSPALQVMLIDVMAILFTALLAALLLVFLVVRWCLRLLCRRNGAIKDRPKRD